MTSKIRSNIIGHGLSTGYLAFLKRHPHATRCRLLMPGLRFDDKLSLKRTMPSTVRDGASLDLYLPRVSTSSIVLVLVLVIDFLESGKCDPH
jgi:hypothetical protein